MVGQFNGMFVIPSWNDGGHRAKGLFVKGSHSRPDLGEKSDWVIATRAFRQFTSEATFRPRCDRPPDLPMQFLPKVGARQGADGGRGIEGIADDGRRQFR